MASSVTTVNLLLFAGDTFAGTITILGDDGAAFDLTDASGTVQVHASGEVLLSGPLTISDAENGVATWSIANTDTDVSPGRYPYFVRFTFSDGTVSTVLTGELIVKRGVV